MYFSLGEANITRGAGIASIIQMVSSNASLSADAIIGAGAPSQALFFQLYKHRDDIVAEARVRDIERLGYKAIFLTVDAIVAGNREIDIRNPWLEEEEENGATQVYDPAQEDRQPGGQINLLGTAGALVAANDRDMTWGKVYRIKYSLSLLSLIQPQTIPWLRSISKLPIVVKGEYANG